MVTHQTVLKEFFEVKQDVTKTVQNLNAAVEQNSVALEGQKQNLKSALKAAGFGNPRLGCYEAIMEMADATNAADEWGNKIADWDGEGLHMLLEDKILNSLTDELCKQGEMSQIFASSYVGRNGQAMGDVLQPLNKIGLLKQDQAVLVEAQQLFKDVSSNFNASHATLQTSYRSDQNGQSGVDLTAVKANAAEFCQQVQGITDSAVQRAAGKPALKSDPINATVRASLLKDLKTVSGGGIAPKEKTPVFKLTQ